MTEEATSPRRQRALSSTPGVRPASRTAAPSRTTARVTHEALRRRDIDVVAWLAEQYGARVDQLEVLMGCGPRTVQRSVARLRVAGLARTQRMLVGEPAWVTPTGAGLAACGSGFGVWRPRIGLLAHVAAVNDVRLHIQGRAPTTVWVPERVLARDAVLYFCAAGPHRQLTELAESGRWPTLGVRELPTMSGDSERRLP
jgi:hypothetical protein